MNILSDSIKHFIAIDFSDVRTYFVSLTLTIIFTYLLIVVFRKIMQQLFKRTTLLEEKKKETIESVVKNTSRYIFAIIILIAAIKPFVVDLKEVIVAGGSSRLLLGSVPKN